MKGIYKISNIINNKVYIGQSIDIMRRWRAHISSSVCERRDPNTLLHQAMKTLGPENFKLEVSEECENLNEREIYWIKTLQTKNPNGYNMTSGGTSVQGENNPRALLTEDDVKTIRFLYSQKVPFRRVFELYQGSISKRGLQKVWLYKTWQKIMPEVYTEENRKWHSTMAKGFSQDGIGNNLERRISEEQVINIKKLTQEGFSQQKIAEIVGVSKSTARRYGLNLESNNPIPEGIKVKNNETQQLFCSYAEAARWAKCDRHTISKWLNTSHFAGIVPDSNIGATWTNQF